MAKGNGPTDPVYDVYIGEERTSEGVQGLVLIEDGENGYAFFNCPKGKPYGCSPEHLEQMRETMCERKVVPIRVTNNQVVSAIWFFRYHFLPRSKLVSLDRIPDSKDDVLGSESISHDL